MSSDIPELGSKISLISNADIRYEGKLYSVDPQECTIALSSVRSFGTEERKVTNRVPAQAQIYDFILFRATDIKDISVVPSTHLLYDPAIVQLSGPSAMAGRPFGGIGASSSLDSSGGGGGPGGGDFGGSTGRPMGPIGAPPTSSSMNPFGAAGGGGSSSGVAPGGVGAGPIGSGGGNFSAMQSGLLHSLTRPSPSELLHHQTPSSSSSMKQHDILTGSRNSPPAMNKKPSPIDQQNARSNSRKSFSSADVPSEDGMMNRSHQDKSRKGRNDQQNYNNQGNSRPRYNQNQQQIRNHMGTGRSQQNHQQQPNPNSNWNQHRGGNGGMGQQQNSSGGVQQGRMRGPRNNAGGVGTNGPRPNYNNARPSGGQNRPKPQPLKFESDYDFDKANTEFEELRSELSKIKIDAPTPLPVANGDDSSKSGEWPASNATANNDGGATSGDDATGASEPQYFYNKNKSFFDNISCEAVERSKGTQKTDWRKERKLNTETFGVASSRRNNYYRNNQRGPGGYGYGGYGGGFRQYQQFFKRHIQQPPQRPSQPQIRPRPIPYELLPMRPRPSIPPIPFQWLATTRVF